MNNRTTNFLFFSMLAKLKVFIQYTLDNPKAHTEITSVSLTFPIFQKENLQGVYHELFSMLSRQCPTFIFQNSYLYESYLLKLVNNETEKF